MIIVIVTMDFPNHEPTNTAEYSRLRNDTSNILKRLKKQCECDLEDLELSLDEKKTKVLEQIDNALLTVSAIPGHFTSTLELSKHLVTDFSDLVKNYIVDIGEGIKKGNPNGQHPLVTRA